MKSLPSPSKIPESLRSRLKLPGRSTQAPTVTDNGARVLKKDPDVFVRTKTFGGLRVIDQNKPPDNAQTRREQFRRNTPRRHTLAISSSPGQKKDAEKPARSHEELREEFKYKLMKKFPKPAENYYGDAGSSASEDGFKMRPGPGKRHAARRRTTVVNYNPDSSRSTDQDERNTSLSEVDTESVSSQPLQRGGSLRSSLPIVRSPNYSFDRSIGLVFLIFGDETKRGVLPNEVTHIDTVRALFVRSFPDKLSMPLLEARPQLKIYIQDLKSRVFYQLEDLRDIQEHCVLKLHYCDSQEPQRVKEYTKVRGRTILTPPRPTSASKSPTLRGEYSQRNGVDQTSLKTKSLPVANSNFHDPAKRPQQMRDLPEIRYRPLTPDVAHTSPEGRWRGVPTEEHHRMLPERPFSPDRLALGTIPENRQPSPGSRRHTSPRDLARSRSTQSTPTPMDNMAPNSGRSTPTASLAPHQYSKYRSLSPTGRNVNPLPHRSPPGQFVRDRNSYHSDGSPQVKHGPMFPTQAPMYVAKGVRATTCSTFSPQRATAALPPRETDLRDGHGRRDPDRASARNSLVYPPPTGMPPIPRQPVIRGPADRAEGPRRPQNLGPSNSSSDGQICQRSQSYRLPGERNDLRPRPRSVTPQPADYDPEAKFRIEKMEAQLANLTAWVHSAVVTSNGSDDPGSRSNSLRSLQSGSGKSTSTSSNTIVVHRYAQGLNDLSTVSKHTQTLCQAPMMLPKELSHGLLLLHKRTIELKLELKGIRRLHQLNMEGARESIDDVYGKIKVALTTVPGVNNKPVRQLRLEVDTICDTFKHDKVRVQKELRDLEVAVEEMRNDVISRQCRVNMSEVEGMALALSQIAKSLAELKGRLPPLISSLKSVMAGEMEVVVSEEKFVKEEPDIIETCLRKCKKLTGTLFTMKRLASVQEQRPPQVPVIPTQRDDGDRKGSVFDNIQSLVPNHDARLQSLEAASASRARKRKLHAQQEALRFEKNLELATKNLKSKTQGKSSGSDSGRSTPEVDGKEALNLAGSSDKISNVGRHEANAAKRVPRSQSLDPDDRSRDDPESLSNQKMAARAEFFRSLRSASPPNLPKQTSKLDWVVQIPQAQSSSSSPQEPAPVRTELSSPSTSPVSRVTQPSQSKAVDSAPTNIPQPVHSPKSKSGAENGDRKKVPPPPPPRSSTRTTNQSQPSFSSFYSTISSPSKLDCSAADDQSNLNIKASRAAGLPVASTPLVGGPKKPANNFEKGIMNVVYVNVHHTAKDLEPSKPSVVKLNVVDNPADNNNDQESEGESTSSVDSQHEVWRLRAEDKGAKSNGSSAPTKLKEDKVVLARKKPPPPPQRKSSVLSRKGLTERLQDQTTKTLHLHDQHHRLEQVESEQGQLSKQHQILEEEQKLRGAKGGKKQP